MQLAQAGENLKALREIADVLIAECKAGNIQAIRELADRLSPSMRALADPATFPLGEDRDHLQERPVGFGHVGALEPNVKTARGRDWNAAQVRNVLARAG